MLLSRGWMAFLKGARQGADGEGGGGGGRIVSVHVGKCTLRSATWALMSAGSRFSSLYFLFAPESSAEQESMD